MSRMTKTAAIIGSCAGIALMVAAITGSWFDRGAKGVPYEPVSTVKGPRDRLALCVAAMDFDSDGNPLKGDPTVELAAKSALQQALVRVAQHPYWVPAGYADRPAVVDIGCPSVPLPLTTTGIKWYGGEPDSYYCCVPSVNNESYYRIFAFVLPSLDDIDRLIGGTRSRVGTQEMVWSSSNPSGLPATEDTEAIYLTPDDLDGVDFLAALVSESSGLSR